MINRYVGFFTVLIFSALFSFNAQGQSKKVWLYKAEESYEKRDYASALRYYQMVLDDTLAMSSEVLPYEVVLSNQKLEKEPGKSGKDKMAGITDHVNHQIAMCYRHSQDYPNAVAYFKITSEKPAYVDDIYFLGNTLMYMGNYEEALAAFEKFIAAGTGSEHLVARAYADISGCTYGMTVEEPEPKITVELADTAVFNAGLSSFAAMYWNTPDAERVVFTSARTGSVIFDPETQDPRFLCDLYYSEKNEDGTWGRAVNFGRPLNSARHDASGCFNNGNVIYYTRWSDEDRVNKQIYLARMIDMRFFESLTLDSNVNLPGFESINPCITSDNKYMYFSSNRPGGYGGFDIWRVELDENGSPVGEPHNLGEPLNSEYDEKSPFFHENTSSMFFSSDGHASMGGLDIFKSNYDPESDFFEMPVNLGIPINSKFDDSYYVTDSELRNGFITSNRAECTDCDSTYKLCSHCYKIYHVVQPEPEFKIKGYVYDEVTEEVIPGATIAFKDVTYQWEHFEIVADENGYYEHDLVPDLELFLRASMKDYFADKAVVFTRGQLYSKVYRQDFYLEKIPKGEITIEGIEYDYDSANLRPESKVILDRLIEFLELNNNLKIEIRSHTDERGSATYNQKLSDGRAKSVVDYLISKGIPAERLVAKGYGESTPAEVPDENGRIVTLTPEYIYGLPDKNKQEEYHQRNRRTAFFVLEQN
jgi:OmpA-OmpF porin, OOP family